MASKRSYALNTLLLSFFVLLAARVPLLPIRMETKKSLGYPRDSLLNFTELTGKYGYYSEQHTVVTEDGYILTAFRILNATNCRGMKRSPPVLLMHGLLQSSDSWIDSGPGAGLAYLVADACYDLWLGNVRGNYYSRRHLRLDPDKDSSFWNFSADEIGFYDVPALVDYIIQNTGSHKINYIGFSQGAGTFYIMCSERPGYCDKIQLSIGLGPASRQTNTASIFYRTLTTTIADFETILSTFGIYEVFSKGGLSQEFVALFCHMSVITQKLCATAIDIFNSAGPLHPGSLNNVTTRTLFGHFPAGTSVHNMARYGQSMRSKDFVKFDYGPQRNLVLYGSVKPPAYNLSAVTVPVLAIHGKNDGLVDIKDVEWVLRKLPHVLETFIVKDPLWNHLDVTYSQYTSEMIFPKINEYLQKYSDIY